jgi:hypothetical protein
MAACILGCQRLALKLPSIEKESTSGLEDQWEGDPKLFYVLQKIRSVGDLPGAHKHTRWLDDLLVTLKDSQ